MIVGAVGGLAVTNWEIGQNYNLFNSNLTMNQNVIVGSGNQPVFKDSMGGSDWTTFVTTFTSDNNTWWNGTLDGAFVVPSPAAGTILPFAQWQSNTGQDADSSWSAPGTDPAAACAVTADAPDYQLSADNGAQTADPAGNAFYNLTTLPLAGMAGTVALTTDGVSSIPGASVAFSPSNIATAGASVLTFSAGLNTPPGTTIISLFSPIPPALHGPGTAGRCSGHFSPALGHQSHLQ